MTVRVSSMEAYREVNTDGTALTQKQTILALLQVSMPLSLREICEATGFDINAVSGRVNDLKHEGKVIECPRRKCSITDRLIIPVTFADERLFSLEVV